MTAIVSMTIGSSSADSGAEASSRRTSRQSRGVRIRDGERAPERVEMRRLRDKRTPATEDRRPVEHLLRRVPLTVREDQAARRARRRRTGSASAETVKSSTGRRRARPSAGRTGEGQEPVRGLDLGLCSSCRSVPSSRSSSSRSTTLDADGPAAHTESGERRTAQDVVVDRHQVRALAVADRELVLLRREMQVCGGVQRARSRSAATLRSPRGRARSR